MDRGRLAAPGPAANFASAPREISNTSAGRFPDGADTASNCADFHTQAAASLVLPAPGGATNLVNLISETTSGGNPLDRMGSLLSSDDARGNLIAVAITGGDLAHGNEPVRPKRPLQGGEGESADDGPDADRAQQ